MNCQENNQKNCAYESIIYLKKRKKKKNLRRNGLQKVIIQFAKKYKYPLIV